METDCKSVGFAYAGSNPARPIANDLDSIVAFIKHVKHVEDVISG
jgi:hypothetical protein